MKFIVRVFIPAEPDKPGSSHEYTVDDGLATYGEVVASSITGAVDVRADPEGRLAELRRHLIRLAKTAPRYSTKPSGAKLPGARVQYFPTSRLTGREIRVELRHFDKPDVPSNPDAPN